MPNDTIPLPEPWDYCYEWDGPFGTRKFSAASYNGNRPDRSVPIYTADQMHAHAAAVSAADNAALRAELAKHQESEFHPDWSMLEATRDSLAEHQQIIRDLRERINVLERIKVLEDALLELVGACDDDSVTRFEEALSAARAALGDKT